MNQDFFASILRFQGSPIQHSIGRRREHQLLLHCARTEMTEDRIGEVLALLLQGGIDWAYLLECGGRHRVLPLIYANFKRHLAKRVPADILESLRTCYYTNLVSSIIQSRGLLRITTLLNASSIPVLAFKGPTLAALAYGNTALRQSGDLDLLVRRKDIHEIGRLLHSQGYRSSLPLPPREEAYFLQHYHEHSFFADDLRVSLDVHWSLMPPYYTFAMDTDELLQRSTTVALDGAAIRTLGPEDLLLFLCLHGSKHRWESLSWICDIQELINSQLKIDWERVARDARRLGLERMLASGLEIARNLLGTRLPDEVPRSLPVDRMTRELATEVEVSLFREDRESPVEAPCQLSRYFLKSMSQWRDRFLACAQAFMIPSYYEFLAIHFPTAAFFLYYLFRPMRLAAKYTKGLLPS